jgi:hypothetical protein
LRFSFFIAFFLLFLFGFFIAFPPPFHLCFFLEDTGELCVISLIEDGNNITRMTGFL